MENTTEPATGKTTPKCKTIPKKYMSEDEEPEMELNWGAYVRKWRWKKLDERKGKKNWMETHWEQERETVEDQYWDVEKTSES